MGTLYNFIKPTFQLSYLDKFSGRIKKLNGPHPAPRAVVLVNIPTSNVEITIIIFYFSLCGTHTFWYWLIFFFQALKNDLLIFTVICQTVPDLWPLIKTCCILDCSSSPVWSFPPAPALFTLIKHTHTHTHICVCSHAFFNLLFNFLQRRASSSDRATTGGALSDGNVNRKWEKIKCTTS